MRQVYEGKLEMGPDVPLVALQPTLLGFIRDRPVPFFVSPQLGLSGRPQSQQILRDYRSCFVIIAGA